MKDYPKSHLSVKQIEKRKQEDHRRNGWTVSKKQ